MGLRWQTELARTGKQGSQKRTIVILGDSIVYGWGTPYEQSYPALLQDHLNSGLHPQERVRVINAGIPGDTVLHGCERFARDVAPFRPAVVLLAFGLNDGALRRTPFDAQRETLWRARRYPWARLRLVLSRYARSTPSPDTLTGQREALARVQPNFFSEALGELVRRTRRGGARAYLLPMVPRDRLVLSEAQWESYIGYDTLIAQAAMRLRAPLIEYRKSDPFHPTEMSAEDGVHLSAAGQRWLGQQVYTCLRAHEPAMRPIRRGDHEP